jgi:thiosulfate/3-mercaptopyruvate sulfurtransferase
MTGMCWQDADVIAPVVSAADLPALDGPAQGLRWHDGRPLVVADVRWYLDGRDGNAAYREAHLPGAVFVDLEAHLAAHGRPAVEGRHPFPTAEAFAASMGALGIAPDAVVVAYDDAGGFTSARLVVMLRMLGQDAAVLDGGLTSWAASGRPVESGEGTVRRAIPVGVRPWPTERFASADETLAAAASGEAVLDARARERFTGEVAMIDPRPGHLPGARSAPWSAVLGEGSHFRSPSELRDHFHALGADTGRPVAYCGSGVSACVNLVAMERAGLEPARLYAASFSGWSADPDHEVETGLGTTP